MPPRFSCALNGVTPESIDPTLRVTDLTELPPKCRIVTAPTGKHGLRLLRRVRESLTVRIFFIIPEYDPARRRALAAKLHAWGENGGLLTVSDRPGQQLRVVCDTLPMLSALCWSDEIRMEFTAYTDPFWEFAEATRAEITDAGTLTLPGSAVECPASVTATNLGNEPLTTITLTCGDTQMTFEDLALAPGETLILQMADGLLEAAAADVSILMCRTPESSDLLLAMGGTENAVSVQADQPVQAAFKARGRLL